jgi:RNA polymerase sigma-70 factor (ECF subfamily)
MDDESQLLAAMARHDPLAWAAMYDRHVGDIFGVIFHLVTGDRNVAEDINQEVWLLAIDQFDRFDPKRGEFRNWLFGIARHRALRHRRRGLGVIPDDSVDGASDGLSPPELLAEIERAGIVRAALLALQEDHRRVLVDKYVSGLTVAEIAERTGRSAKAVESLLSRARARLRDQLRPYFFAETEGERHEPSEARSD